MTYGEDLGSGMSENIRRDSRLGKFCGRNFRPQVRKLRLDEPLDADGRIVPGSAAFVFRRIVASRVTFPLIEAFEDETSVVSEYLGFT